MKTLVIPDLHHRCDHADYWITAFDADRVVFLGDYFDDYHDTPGDAVAMATWLRNRVEGNPHWTFIVGNHDLPYLFPLDDRFMAPGFCMSKRREIAGVIRGMDRSRFALSTWVAGDVLLSHAGLHPGWLRHENRGEAERLLREAGDALLRGTWHPLLAAGQDRGGMSWQPSIGGVAWMDWRSLRPLSFCHQIVGHTPGTHPRHRTWYARCNLCIDIGNGLACAMVEDHQEHGKIIKVHERTGASHAQTLEIELD